MGPLAAPIGVEGTAFISTPLANNTAWPDIQVYFKKPSNETIQSHLSIRTL
jgi:hypothetical protein